MEGNTILRDSAPLVNDVDPSPGTPPDPTSGKAFAMWLHNYCGVDLESTQHSFDRHPQWRSE